MGTCYQISKLENALELCKKAKIQANPSNLPKMPLYVGYSYFKQNIRYHTFLLICKRGILDSHVACKIDLISILSMLEILQKGLVCV